MKLLTTILCNISLVVSVEFRTLQDDTIFEDGVTYRAGNGATGGKRADVKFIRTEMCKLYQPTKKLSKCGIDADNVETMLRNYGCNCHPENFDTFGIDNANIQPTYNMGKNGRPLDDLDKACTALRDAYTCIEFDAEKGLFIHPDENSGDSVDLCGRDTEFVFHINTTEKSINCGPSDNKEYENGILATEECPFAVCNIVRKFAEDVAPIISSGSPNAHRTANAGLYDVYDQPDVCIKQNNGFGANTCCGEYPNRHPFIDFIKVCCDTGTGFHPVFIGECP